MKKIKWLLAALLVIVGGYFIYSGTQCSLDGKNACLVSGESYFKVEEGAQLSVQVENEALKNYLLEEWDRLYPKTSLEVFVQPVLSLEELSTLPYDIMVANQEDAAYFMNEFQDLGSNANNIIGSRIPVNLQDAINLKGFYMAQNSVSGQLFAYNETLMNELGLGNINSFEMLFENEAKIKESLETVFPISFLDQESFYPFLTSGGWALYDSHISSKPGFDSDKFLEGLRFIAEMNRYNISSSDLLWNYESSFYNRQSLFAIISDHELASQYEVLSGDTYRYAPFITYKDVHMSTMSSVNGYVVKRDTGYTSAAAEVVRILRSPEAISLNNFGEFIPIYHGNHLEELNLEKEQLELVEAYAYSTAYPIIALESNPSVLARSSYREVHIMDVLSDVYDKKISPEEAQEIIVNRWDEWLISKEVSEDVE